LNGCVMVLDWCCMCKRDGESIDHLMLHCIVAQELWDLVFSMFGITWVMPRRVMEIMACWHEKVSKRGNGVLWDMIPHCLMWGIWRERNART
jgi:hypothetical protein